MDDTGMIERVARAIAAATAEQGGVAQVSELDRYDYREIARAAIEAMRKPTDDMAQAGFTSDAFRTQELRLNTDFEPKVVWRAMIDAALTSPQ